MRDYKIAIIGTGNVGWHLATVLDAAGHTITEIYNRNFDKAEWLADQLYHAEPVNDLDFTESAADLYLICVPDAAILQVAARLKVPAGAIVAHTSGSQPLDLIEGLGFYAAVFYPLQTLTAGKRVDFTQVPICLEAADDKVLKYLHKLALTISKQVVYLSSEQRKSLHMSAVFACNFVNHMMHLASNILEAEEMDFSLLHGLIAETVNKALEIGPAKAQTGPAVRNDQVTIAKHLELLDTNPELRNIYETLSKSILANR